VRREAPEGQLWGHPQEKAQEGADAKERRPLKSNDTPQARPAVTINPGVRRRDPTEQGRGMEMRTLGRTGVKVSPLCLGAMMFGLWGNEDHDDSIRIIHHALDSGINFVDTADMYSAGESETIVGKALAGGKRDNVILATKAHAPMGFDPNEQGNSRRWLIREVESSLRRLDTDYIDLYQIHRPSPDTAIDETLAALTDLIRAGKVRYAGSSTFPAHEIVEAQYRDRGRERFVCEQPPYSLLVRGIERDVLPVAQEYGMGVIPWSPLAGGWLSGKWRKGADDLTSRRSLMLPDRYDLSKPENQRKLDAADALGQLADDSGMSLIHLAIAFVINHPGVTSAIIGPRTMEQLESQLGSADVSLSEDVLDAIDAIVAPGTTILASDAGYDPPALTDKSLRRR
jgi:aryl-alcohol dehydrogenase-like predicted oxidoreductase